MRGYFDNDEPEVEEPEQLEERRHDTEVTLSTGAQLGIVFCLLLLCGLCFGLGYWVGHGRSPAAPATAATQPAAPTAAPDQEPLQGNGTLPKPSADAQVPPTHPPDEGGGTPPAPASDTNPATDAAPADTSGDPSAARASELACARANCSSTTAALRLDTRRRSTAKRTADVQRRHIPAPRQGTWCRLPRCRTLRMPTCW